MRFDCAMASGLRVGPLKIHPKSSPNLSKNTFRKQKEKSKEKSDFWTISNPPNPPKSAKNRSKSALEKVVFFQSPQIIERSPQIIERSPHLIERPWTSAQVKHFGTQGDYPTIIPIISTSLSIDVYMVALIMFIQDHPR